jgi:hypothetical protein
VKFVAFFFLKGNYVPGIHISLVKDLVKLPAAGNCRENESRRSDLHPPPVSLSVHYAAERDGNALETKTRGIAGANESRPALLPNGWLRFRRCFEKHIFNPIRRGIRSRSG